MTALAFARQGADVLLLEAQPQVRRLAGEWLHPPGARVLRQLEIGPFDSAVHPVSGRGFVVFPEDGSAPIPLPYPEGAQAISCEHRALVLALREAVDRDTRIRLVLGAQADLSAGKGLTFTVSGSGETTLVPAPLIVGADGRSSLVRRHLGLPEDRKLLSFMAGVRLDDVELPYEGFGHLFLGGPGPVFVVRIGPRQARAFLDVPLASARELRTGDALYRRYGPALPLAIRSSLARALAQPQALAWAANHWRSRSHYGRNGLVLVGDAVGHFHPLTAVGMTLGIMDGYTLAHSRNFTDYREQRLAATWVPEMLCAGLYEVFAGTEESCGALRHALYRMWRQSPAECRWAMRLLSGDDTNWVGFNRAFLRVLALAMRQLVRDASGSGQWRQAARTLTGLGGWLGWLASGNVPRL